MCVCEALSGECVCVCVCVCVFALVQQRHLIGSVDFNLMSIDNTPAHLHTHSLWSVCVCVCVCVCVELKPIHVSLLPAIGEVKPIKAVYHLTTVACDATQPLTRWSRQCRRWFVRLVYSTVIKFFCCGVSTADLYICSAILLIPHLSLPPRLSSPSINFQFLYFLISVQQ